MWTIPYLVSVLCMQLIAINKAALSANEERRAQPHNEKLKKLKGDQLDEERELLGDIKDWEDEVKKKKKELVRLKGALQGLLPSSPGKWLTVINN